MGVCKKVKSLSSAVGLSCLLASSSVCWASQKSKAVWSAQTDRILAFADSGDFNNAISLTELMCCKTGGRAACDAALKYALLGYLKWQSGETDEALIDARRAMKLAPANEVYSFNYGVMALSAGDASQAEIAFALARKVCPRDAAAAMGLYKSYVVRGKREEASGVLSSTESGNSGADEFKWFEDLGEFAYSFDNLPFALRNLQRAAQLAHMPEQKAVNDLALYLTMVRRNEFKVARSLLLRILEENYWRNSQTRLPPEFYGLTVRNLAVDDLELGQKLLVSAESSMVQPIHADVMFGLGQAFEENARYLPAASVGSRQWLILAARAYNRALSMNDRRAVFSLASARLALKEETTKLMEALSAAGDKDKLDCLPRYLLKQLKSSFAEGVDSSVILKHPLTKISVKIEGPDCDCQISHLRAALRANPAVAYFCIPCRKPFGGTIFVDSSVSDFDQFCALASKQAFPKGVAVGTERVPVHISVIGITNTVLSAALDADINAKAGEIPAFDTNLAILKTRKPI